MQASIAVRKALLGLILFGLMRDVCAQQLLIASARPVSLGVQFQENTFVLQADVLEATSLTLYCPVRPGLISIDGMKEKIEAKYDLKQNMMELLLPPGKYRFHIRALP